MRLSIFLITSFLALTSFGQSTDSTDCRNFKTGSFYVINGEDTCYINRTETRQTEKCNNSDTEYELIVIWIKARTYILRDIHYNPSTKPRVMRNDIVMTVMEVRENYHVVHVKSKGTRNRTMTVYCNKQG